MNIKITIEDSTVKFSIDDDLKERIIQEEIWAQTIWPENEPSVLDQLEVELNNHFGIDAKEYIKNFRV